MVLICNLLIVSVEHFPHYLALFFIDEFLQFNLSPENVYFIIELIAKIAVTKHHTMSHDSGD